MSCSSIGLQQLIGLFLGDLPTDGLVFQGSTVLWAYLTGVVVTVVSAIAPARRATHIPPVAALRDDVALPESSLRRRALVGTAMLGLGIAAMAAGLVGDAGILLGRSRGAGHLPRRGHAEPVPQPAGGRRARQPARRGSGDPSAGWRGRTPDATRAGPRPRRPP